MSSWKFIWVVIYVLGLVLPPPIHFHDRLIFASEYLLLPLFLFNLGLLLRGKISKPPKALIWVWMACVVAYIAGYFRGDLALRVSIYDLGSHKYFSFFDDGIFFFRMVTIFSTPWFLKNFFNGSEIDYFKIFIKTFKMAISISAILAILDYKSIHLIDLGQLGYYDDALYQWWAYRAHGTFLTPIEASFMYGAAVVYLLTSGESLKSPLNLLTLTLALVAMILTHGGTAIIGVLISFSAFLYSQRKLKKINPVFVGVFALVIFSVALFVLPNDFFRAKILDFLYRQKTYWRYLTVLKEKPSIALWGIGFSKVCADNNFIALWVQGGILLFLAVLNWVWDSVVAAPKTFRYVFVFWVITWLSFDSIGFWGIGRLCWFLLGF